MYLFQSATLTFKNGFFLIDTPIHCRLYPHKLIYVKLLMGVSRLPLLWKPSGGIFSVRNSGAREKKIVFCFNV